MLRKQREKDEELARAKAEREAENARRALERKLQLQDKVGGSGMGWGGVGGCGEGSGCWVRQDKAGQGSSFGLRPAQLRRFTPTHCPSCPPPPPR